MTAVPVGAGVARAAGTDAGPPLAAWAHIRAGRSPDADLLGSVAAMDLATLGSGGVSDAQERLRVQLLGAGPLEPLLDDERVTDIAVNGDGAIWVDRGCGLEHVGALEGGGTAVRQLAIRLAGLAGRRLDETCAFVDGQLPSGVRLHAILPPLVAGGAHLTLRVPARVSMSLTELRARGMCGEEVLVVLRALVRRRLAFLVTGGTGAGRRHSWPPCSPRWTPTTASSSSRMCASCRWPHPHVVRLEARPSNVEGAGEVTLTTLVRQALRMRPDRIVLGEARGAEVRELLAALNTGHEGGCGTVHANSVEDVVARFEALGALAGLSPVAVQAQLASAVDVVVHVARRVERGAVVRAVEAVGVVVPDAGGRPRVVQALTVVGGGQGVRGPAWPELAGRLGLGPGGSRDTGAV